MYMNFKYETEVALNKLIKIAFGSVIGTIIEYFDFLAAGTIAILVWPKLFFGPYGGIFGAISTFALGIIIRPIGAIIFGHLADKIGRRDSLAYAILIMGISTLVIGLLPVPTASTQAIIVVILILMRLLQGISIGAEFGTASTWIREYADKSKNRAFWASWVGFGVAIGTALAAGLVLGLQLYQGTSFFASGSYYAGWRIVFYTGFVAAVIGLIIRLKLDDSWIFEKLKIKNKILNYPSFAVLKEMPKQVLLMSTINAFFGALFYLVYVFGQSYMIGIGYQPIIVTEIIAIGALAMLFMIWIGSIIADKYGRKVPIIISITIVLIFSIPYFVVLNTLNPIFATLSVILMFSAGFGIGFGSVTSIYPEYFPTRYRASGANVSFQLSQIYGGGMAPIIASYIFGYVKAVAAYPYIATLTIFYATLAFLTMYIINETKQKNLENYE